MEWENFVLFLYMAITALCAILGLILLAMIAATIGG